jgi:hypothetical protein
MASHLSVSGQSGQTRAGKRVLPLSGISPEPLAVPAAGAAGAFGAAFGRGAADTSPAAGLAAAALVPEALAADVRPGAGVVVAGAAGASDAGGSADCCAALAMRTLAESLSFTLVTTGLPR